VLHAALTSIEYKLTRLSKLAFVIPTSEVETCVDPITPHSIYSSSRCGATGILFQFGILAASLYTLFTAIYLHICLVWARDPGQTFMLLALSASTMMPVIAVGITIAVSGYAYGMGNMCLVEHEKSAGVFYGWLIIIGTVTLLINCSTGVFVGLKHWRKNDMRGARRSLTLDGGPVAQGTNIVAILEKMLRQTLTAVVIPIQLLPESMVAFAFVLIAVS
jgi:hypothetical protein